MDKQKRDAEILHLYQQGWKKTDISRRLGVDRGVVTNVCLQYDKQVKEGIQTDDPQPETPDWQAALMEFLQKNQSKLPPAFVEMITPAIPTVQASSPVVYSDTVYRRIAFISDVHIPYEDKVAVRVTLDAVADLKPDCIILGGDIFDFYEVSDFDRDPGRRKSLQDEFDEGQFFLKSIASITPDVVFMEGNHEQRLQRVIGRNPGLYKLRALELPKAIGLPDGWKFYPSQTHFHVGRLNYLHGDVKGMSDRAMYPSVTVFKRLKTSSMFGHYHRFDKYYETQYDGTLRGGFANGHLSDTREAKYIVNPNWQTGFSIVENLASGHGFQVQQYLIVNGTTIVHGKDYSV